MSTKPRTKRTPIHGRHSVYVDDEGAPRGVVLSAETLAFTAEAAARLVDDTPEDVVLNALPMSAGFGLQQTLATLRSGATLVLEPSFAYPAAVLNRIAEIKATGFPIMPAMAGILLHVDTERFDLSSLAMWSTCAVPRRKNTWRG